MFIYLVKHNLKILAMCYYDYRKEVSYGK